VGLIFRRSTAPSRVADGPRPGLLSDLAGAEQGGRGVPAAPHLRGPQRPSRGVDRSVQSAAGARLAVANAKRSNRCGRAASGTEATGQRATVAMSADRGVETGWRYL